MVQLPSPPDFLVVNILSQSGFNWASRGRGKKTPSILKYGISSLISSASQYSAIIKHQWLLWIKIMSSEKPPYFFLLKRMNQTPVYNSLLLGRQIWQHYSSLSQTAAGPAPGNMIIISPEIGTPPQIWVLWVLHSAVRSHIAWHDHRKSCECAQSNVCCWCTGTKVIASIS